MSALHLDIQNSESILKLTPAAVNKIKYLMAQESQPSCLHLRVEGGGCNGFSYKFSFISITDEMKIDESSVLVHDSDKVILAIDKRSLPYIKGATLDYMDELMATKFIISNNPNSTSGCGCGNSFSVL